MHNEAFHSIPFNSIPLRIILESTTKHSIPFHLHLFPSGNMEWTNLHTKSVRETSFMRKPLSTARMDAIIATSLHYGAFLLIVLLFGVFAKVSNVLVLNRDL